MIKINVYLAAGEWFGARWIDGKFDGCDPIGLGEDATVAEAIARAALMPLTVDGPREIECVNGDA